MEFEIRNCKDAVENWKGLLDFGLFINGYLITVLGLSKEIQVNVENVFTGSIKQLDVNVKVNTDLSNEVKVFDLFVNGKFISRFAEKTMVYQNVFKVFDLEKI